MEREMTQLCELTQIGRIGKVKEVGQNLMISVASDASYKKDGDWVNRANWIEHTVFGRRDRMKDWALDTLQAGDLVFIRSTPSQTNWEKDGEKQYGYTMAVTELKLLTAKADLTWRPFRCSGGCYRDRQRHDRPCQGKTKTSRFWLRLPF